MTRSNITAPKLGWKDQKNFEQAVLHNNIEISRTDEEDFDPVLIKLAYIYNPN